MADNGEGEGHNPIAPSAEHRSALGHVSIKLLAGVGALVLVLAALIWGITHRAKSGQAAADTGGAGDTGGGGRFTTNFITVPGAPGTPGTTGVPGGTGVPAPAPLPLPGSTPPPLTSGGGVATTGAPKPPVHTPPTVKPKPPAPRPAVKPPVHKPAAPPPAHHAAKAPAHPITQPKTATRNTVGFGMLH